MLVFTERCQDNGWKMRFKGYTRADWFTTYTRVCALDYLERRDAKPGDYLVAVYRTGEISAGKGLYLGSVRLRWPPVTPSP